MSLLLVNSIALIHKFEKSCTGTVIAAGALSSGWGYSFLIPGFFIAGLGVLIYAGLVVQPSDVGLPSPHEPPRDSDKDDEVIDPKRLRIAFIAFILCLPRPGSTDPHECMLPLITCTASIPVGPFTRSRTGKAALKPVRFGFEPFRAC